MHWHLQILFTSRQWGSQKLPWTIKPEASVLKEKKYNLAFYRQNRNTILERQNVPIAVLDTMCFASPSLTVSFLRPCFLPDIGAASQAPELCSQTAICWVLVSPKLRFASHPFPQLSKGCLDLLQGCERRYSRGEQKKQILFGNEKKKKKGKKLERNETKLLTPSLLYMNPYKQIRLGKAIPQMGCTHVPTSLFRMYMYV